MNVEGNGIFIKKYRHKPERKFTFMVVRHSAPYEDMAMDII